MVWTFARAADCGLPLSCSRIVSVRTIASWIWLLSVLSALLIGAAIGTPPAFAAAASDSNSSLEAAIRVFGPSTAIVGGFWPLSLSVGVKVVRPAALPTVI